MTHLAPVVQTCALAPVVPIGALSTGEAIGRGVNAGTSHRADRHDNSKRTGAQDGKKGEKTCGVTQQRMASFDA